MLPATALSLAVLLLLTAPGIWYELLRQRYRPGRKESAYLETGRLLLAGLLLSGTTLLLIAAVRFVAPAAVLDLRLLLTSDGYFAGHLRLAALNLVEFVILGITLAAAWLHATATTRPSSPTFPESAWSSAFARFPREASRTQGVPWSGKAEVEVQLTDGPGSEDDSPDTARSCPWQTASSSSADHCGTRSHSEHGVPSTGTGVWLS